MKMMSSLLTAVLLAASADADTNVHTRAEIAARHAVAGTNGTVYGAIYAHRQTVALHTVGTNHVEIAKALGPPYPINAVWLPNETHEEIHDTYDARWYVTYSNDGRPVTVERAAIIKDAKANQAAQVTARKLAEPDR
jgi:hypothetical protein